MLSSNLNSALALFKTKPPSLIAFSRTMRQAGVPSARTVARLIAHAALRRLESRGAHYRADFPEHDDINWKAHYVDHRDRLTL